MPKTLLGFTDNEWLIIQSALKFQMRVLLENDDMNLVERTYAQKLGELSDQIKREI